MRFLWSRRSVADADPVSDPADGSDERIETDDAPTDPVSNVLKRTDVWFQFRVADLEAEVRELAEAHAKAGQPRHDVRHDEPLPVETVIESRAVEVLRNWADRVRLKIDGAVQTEVEALGHAVSDLREGVAGVATARAELEAGQRELSREHRSTGVAARSAEKEEIVEIESILPRALVVGCLVLLVFADMFANLPVFQELFPTNASIRMALERWEQTALATGEFPWYFGLEHMLRSLLAFPEPAILAFVVVVFFLVLGHKLGASLRRVVALWRSRAFAVRTRWRQAFVPVALCTVGVVLTLSFLYGARARVLPMSQARYEAAETRLGGVREEISALEAAGMEVPASAFERESAAEAETTLRRARLDYAQTISSVNRPILLLNIALVIVAILLGYLGEKGRFSAVPALDREAELRRLRGGVDELRQRFDDRRRAAYDAVRRATIIDARIQALTDARVLKDFEAKRSRIASAIPLFRAENARLRGLDTADILAFQAPPRIDLPSAEDLSLVIQLPRAVETYRAEIAALQESLERHDAAVTRGAELVSDEEVPIDEPQPIGLGI